MSRKVDVADGAFRAPLLGGWSMKRIFSTLATRLVTSLALVLAVSTAFVTTSLVSLPQARAGGSDVPFPLDYPLPFPWNTIEGTWAVESRAYQATFSFDVQNDCNGRQILKVSQIDPDSGDVMADGMGYKIDRTEQVTAAMSGQSGSYMLYVGAYEDTHVSPAKKAYVLRIVSFAGGSSELRFRIHKMSSKVARRGPGLDPECLR